METTETLREPRRLTRPRDGRWLGGVCAGLGAYFELNAVVYRIAFAALTLAGGTGILLYVGAWLLIPDEGAEDSIAAATLKQHRERPSRVVGLLLLAFFGIVVLSEVHVWPSPGNLWLAAALAGAALVWWQLGSRSQVTASGEPRRTLLPLTLGLLLVAAGVVALLDIGGVWNADWRIVIGAMVVVAGAVVAAGAATGRAVGAVAVVGLLLLAALVLALAVRVPLFAGVGDQTETPATPTALERSYKLGVGNLTLDLRKVELPAGETKIKATLAVGDLVVHVPSDATVEVEGRASVGQVSLFDRVDDGTNVHEHRIDGGSGASVLRLDARVGIGEVEVVRG